MKTAEKEMSRYYMNEYIHDHPSLWVEDSIWKVSKILPMVKSKTGIERMLDVGCGAGVILNELSQKLETRHAIGLDVSLSILKKAKFINSRRKNSPSFLQAHAAFLPIKNKSLDISLLIDVLEHVVSPSKVLSEQTRCSKFVVVKVPLEDAFFAVFTMTFRRKEGHIHKFNLTNFLQSMKSAGLNPLIHTIVMDDQKGLKIRLHECIQRNIIRTLLKVILLLFGALLFKLSKIAFTKILDKGYLIVFAENKDW